jgi:hypothetical protein
LSNRQRPNTPVRRVSTETKASTKTTELYMYLAAVAAVVITALVVGDDGNGGADPVSAQDALRYITYLTTPELALLTRQSSPAAPVGDDCHSETAGTATSCCDVRSGKDWWQVRQEPWR